MSKRKIGILFFFSCCLFSVNAYCQPQINGPKCVVPGVIYQYKIAGPTATSRLMNMRVCITGGSIVDENQNKIDNCVQSSQPLSTVLVMWNDTLYASVSVTTSSGNNSLSVNITSPLQAGLIDSSVKMQNLTDTLTMPSTILCSPASGGSCSPNYSYQWQQSNDLQEWTDIQGATGQNLLLTAAAKRSFYYRRKILETGSNTISYSDIAAINLIFPTQ